jgi:hypothetical protein
MIGNPESCAAWSEMETMERGTYPEMAAAVLAYLSLPPGWSIRVVSDRAGFVDLRIHNSRNFYRRTIRVPHDVVESASEDRARAMITALREQLVAQRVRAAGDERMESPILVRVSPP